MFEKYIFKFIISPYLSKYLQVNEIELRDFQIIDTIYYSPTPISVKYNSFVDLIKDADNNGNFELSRQAAIYASYLKEAVSMLKSDGIFSIEFCCFNEMTQDIEDSFGGILASFDDVREYVEEDALYLEPGLCYFYRLTKWEKGTNGKYRTVCDYVMANNTILYADIDDAVDDRIIETVYFIEDLNLPVPYNPGDLLQVDRAPFAPKLRIVILDIGDNSDCCCVQALSKNEEGLWQTGALKHGVIGSHFSPQVSPLYTADIYEGDLQGDDRILGKVSGFIKDVPANAEKLLDKLYSVRGLTDDELLSLIS